MIFVDPPYNTGNEGWCYNDNAPIMKPGRRPAALKTAPDVSRLAGSIDTQYKQSLLNKLTEAFRDERGARGGELELAAPDGVSLVCDMVFYAAWKGSVSSRYFPD